MLASSIPAKLPTPWASSAGAPFIRPIPATSQIGIQAGAASWPDGFVPLNFLPVASGGVPPFGEDMNGVLNALSAWLRWSQAGGPVPYDPTFSAEIGGYPKGALLGSATDGFLWLSTADNNVTDPDTGGAGWLPVPIAFLAQTLVFAGDPNGNVAGAAGVPGGRAPTMVWDTLNQLLWVCTVTGNTTSAVWIANLPAGGLYIAGNTTLNFPVTYLVDTSLVPVTGTFLAGPAGKPLMTFIDAKRTWGANPFTLAGGGNLIGTPAMGQFSSIIARTTQRFSTWWNGSYWELV